MTCPLSVVIPCKDEEQNIVQCIESVRTVADEIVVADSGSTDSTMEKARRAGGCRIIEREFINFPSFKNWSIAQATHRWVLTLDADERLTPALADEIRSLLTREPACDGYKILRLNHFLGHPLRYGAAGNDRILRLFRQGTAGYDDAIVHASLHSTSNRIGRLRAPMLHFSDWTIEDYFRKYERYTNLVADQMYEQKRPIGYLKMLTDWPLQFFKYYVLKRGFLDGMPGLVYCLLSSCYVTTKFVKLWGKTAELQRSAVDPEPAMDPQKVSSQAA